MYPDHLAYAADPGSSEAFTAPKSPGTTHPRGESLGECYNHFSEHEHTAATRRKKVKTRSLLIFVVAGIAAVLVVIMAASAYWERKERLFANAPDLFGAVRAFCGDQAGRGQVPPEVSLQDLVRGGYVSSNEVRAFEGFQVTFSTHYNDDAPQLILARAVGPDGQSTCLLADGSVQQLSPQKYKAYIENSDQLIAATNQIGESRPQNGSSGTNGSRVEP